MLAPGRVVPFNAEPVSSCAGYFADVPNGAERAIVGTALADSELSARRHVVSCSLQFSGQHYGAQKTGELDVMVSSGLAN